MYVRNEQVFKEKIRVLGVCAERAQKVVDANPEADWKAEFAPIERYSYDEMVYKFWIPVKKFYQDIN